MKRKFLSIIAAALVGSMMIGSTVFAADSSTTTNTAVESILNSPAARAGETPYAVPTGNNKGTATVEGVKVTVDYSNAVKEGTETLVPANNVDTKAVAALGDYMSSRISGGVRPLKQPICVRFYSAGRSLDEFGSLPQSVGVGNQYDGRTATVFIRDTKTGVVTELSVVITNGKLNFSVSKPCIFDFVIN